MALKARIDSSIIFVFLIIVILAGTALFIYFQVRSDAVSTRVDSEEQFAVLFTVSDDNDSLLLTEAMVYEPSTARAAIFDIPSNMGAILESLERTDRVEELFRQEGIGAYKSFVGETLGLEIPFYLHFDSESLSTLVDFLTGVNLLVSEPVGQVDLNPDFAASLLQDLPDGASSQETEPGQELPASRFLPAGNVTLEGPKVITYLSHSFQGEEDIDAVNRRQSFTESLLERIAQERDTLLQDRGMDLLEQIVDTNMDRNSLASLIEEIGRLDTERIVRQRVAGSYRTVDVEGETRNLLFPHFEGQWLRETVSQVSDSLDAADGPASSAETIVIEVLNGTTTAGLARQTRDLYQGLGLFEVHDFDNADSNDYEHTQVIDRRGDGRKANRVAEVIQADNVVNQPADDPNTPVDVTVILGQDFDGRYVQQ